MDWISLHEKCLYYMSVEISPYSVRMRENTDQRNFEYEHFSHSVCFWFEEDWLWSNFV